VVRPGFRVAGLGRKQSTDRCRSIAGSYFFRRKNMRDKIILACTECQERNYHTTKNKRLHPERQEFRKFCPRCNQHRPHKETK
jgi:large subunit ribosomal protein L33